MRVTVQVKPNSKKGPLVEETDAGLIVYIREQPIEGRANKAVVELLSRHFTVPKTNISIKYGLSGRQKIIDIKNYIIGQQ